MVCTNSKRRAYYCQKQSIKKMAKDRGQQTAEDDLVNDELINPPVVVTRRQG
jgi:hypothetical protein